MSGYVNICYLFLKDPIAGTFSGNVTGEERLLLVFSLHKLRQETERKLVKAREKQRVNLRDEENLRSLRTSRSPSTVAREQERGFCEERVQYSWRA